MPDNYITIPDEKGSVNISEDVVAAIAGAAIGEIDGVAAFSNTSGPELGELIGKRNTAKGIRVSFSGDAVTVDATVTVRFGVNITAIGGRAQQAAAAAVENMTGLRPQVNVHVAGVSFEK